MSKIFGLAVFWFVADLVATFLSPTAGGFVGWMVLVVVLSGLGSIVLSGILGGDGFDHLFAGFTLAFPGWLLMESVFHWHLLNPAAACVSNAGSQGSCGPGTIIFAMLANLCIVGIGMSIVAIPVVPVIWKLQQQR